MRSPLGAVDAEGCPEQVGQRLRRQLAVRIFARRTPKLERLQQRLTAVFMRWRQGDGFGLFGRGERRRRSRYAREDSGIGFASRDHRRSSLKIASRSLERRLRPLVARASSPIGRTKFETRVLPSDQAAPGTR